MSPYLPLPLWSLRSIGRTQLLLATSLSALLLATTCHVRSAYRAQAAAVAEARRQHLWDHAKGDSDDGSASDADYVQRLRLSTIHSPSVEALVRELQIAGEDLGVTAISVTGSTRAPTPQTLGLLDVTLSLRGRYPNLKQSLADLLSRHPTVVLQHLTLRRLSEVGDIQAHWALSLLAPPEPEPMAAAGVH